MDEAFAAHYGTGIERGRLFDDEGEPVLELARTLELVERYLPAPPAEVLDVGGGPGVYAGILAERGYRVVLVDVLPLHVEQAAADGRFEAKLGDARSLEEPDESFDAVLLFGPLYHLTERADRLRALAEARRVLRPGGVVLAAAISRFASLLDGLSEEFLREPAFREIVERDLREGRHVNPEPVARPEWFTTAHFHHPDELEQEIADAGLALEGVLGVEGPGWLFPELASERDLLAFAARATERDPAARAMSAHLLAVARRP